MTVLVGTTTYDHGDTVASGSIPHNYSAITASASGSATKGFFRAHGTGMSSSARTRIVVYNEDGTSHLGTSDEYAWTGSETDGQLIEVAFSTPVSITSATNYRVCVFQGGANADFKMLIAGGSDIDTGNTYPTPPATLAADAWLGGIVVTVWLEDAGAGAPKRSLLLGIG